MKSLLRGLLAASVGAMAIACATDYAAAPAKEIATDSGAPPAAEAAEMDATVDARDASDAAIVAKDQNLLVNPGFESGCTSWRTVNAVTASVVGREGGSACRVCPAGTTTSTTFGIEQTVSIATGGTALVRASVWTRGAVDGGTPPETELDLTDSAAMSTHETRVPIRSEAWTQGTTDPPFPVTGPGVTLSLLARRAGAACFLVDDASLVVLGQ